MPAGTVSTVSMPAGSIDRDELQQIGDLPVGDRALEVHGQGMRAVDRPVLDRRHGGVDVLARLGIGRLGQRRRHRLGIHRRAAVEGDVVAQGERHRACCRRRSSRRSPGSARLAVRAVFDQAVVEVLDQGEVEREERLRVEIADILEDRDAQRAAILRLGGGVDPDAMKTPRGRASGGRKQPATLNAHLALTS